MGMEKPTVDKSMQALIKKLAAAKTLDKKPPQTAAEIRKDLLDWLERGRKSA